MTSKKGKTGNGVSGQQIHKLDKDLATIQKKLGMKVTGKPSKKGN